MSNYSLVFSSVPNKWPFQNHLQSKTNNTESSVSQETKTTNMKNLPVSIHYHPPCKPIISLNNKCAESCPVLHINSVLAEPNSNFTQSLPQVSSSSDHYQCHCTHIWHESLKKYDCHIAHVGQTVNTPHEQTDNFFTHSTKNC